MAMTQFLAMPDFQNAANMRSFNQSLQDLRTNPNIEILSYERNGVSYRWLQPAATAAAPVSAAVPVSRAAAPTPTTRNTAMTTAQTRSIPSPVPDFKAASSASMAATADWDKYLNDRLSGLLDKYAPELKSVMTAGSTGLREFLTTSLPTLISGEMDTYRQIRSLGATLLTGQIPASVASSVRMATAEGAAARGLGGQVATNLTARDLGTTSLAIQEQGSKFLTGASAVANNLMKLASDTASTLGTYTDAASKLAVLGSTPATTLEALTKDLMGYSTPSANQAMVSSTQQSMEAQKSQLEILKMQQDNIVGLQTLANSAAINPALASSVTSSRATTQALNQFLAQQMQGILGSTRFMA